MSTTDNKTKNKAQEVTAGEAKAGEITGDKSLRAHGKAEQAGANVKQAGETLNDTFKHCTRR
jgi:uncharacterized protein YjbJ (UPF0337 family)